MALLLGFGVAHLSAAMADAQAAATPSRTVLVAPSDPAVGSPLVLRLPASARLLGLANAGVAANDGDAIFYNPGMLTQARGVAVSVQRYGTGGVTGSLGSVQTLGTYTFGVGAQVLQYRAVTADPTAALREGGPRLSERGDLDASSSAFVLGVARALGGFRVGVSARYAEERIGDAGDGTVSVDVGVSKPFGPASLAMSVQHLGGGPRHRYAQGPQPTQFTIGYGGGLFPIWEKWDLGMQTQVSIDRDGIPRPAGGVELAYVPIEGVAIVARTGVRLPRETDEPLVTAGFGLTADRYSVDWAVEPMRAGRPVAHRIGIRIR